MWNEHRPAGPGTFTAAYRELVDRHAADRTAVDRLTVPRDQLDRFFAGHAYRSATFDNPHRLDRDGLLARLASSSYLPADAADPRRTAVLADAAALFDHHERGGTVTLDHDTRVFYGRLD